MTSSRPGIVAEALEAHAHPPAHPLQPDGARDVRREDVDRAAELLRPSIEAIVADRSVSFDRSLVVVVVDPAASPDAPIARALLAQYAFGNASDVDVDYARYAIDKASAAHRGRCDTSLLRERAQARGEADLPLVGGLHRRGWTIGVSGAVPAFDEAIGAMFIELVHALQQHSPT